MHGGVLDEIHVYDSTVGRNWPSWIYAGIWMLVWNGHVAHRDTHTIYSYSVEGIEAAFLKDHGSLRSSLSQDQLSLRIKLSSTMHSYNPPWKPSRGYSRIENQTPSLCTPYSLMLLTVIAV
jgi:hypothetical protein